MYRKIDGFTLIEIIAVLVVLAILVAIAISRFSLDGYSDTAEINTLAQHIRLAQSRSLRQGGQWGIKFDAGSDAYWLFLAPDDGTKKQLPGQSLSQVNVGSLSVSSGSIVSFDRFGRPCSDNNASSQIGNDLVVSIGTKSLTVTQETGFIP
ncbi:prepilin-type N-terminal cleavage/methylation domain-containing protein [Desulfoplanes sp.]